MIISNICIRKPVFATVINLVILLLGIIAYDRLTVREYPKIEEPVVTVETSYPGASAEIIESQVTKIIEDSMAGIEGIEVLSSISRSERSQITVRFKIIRDPDDAANDVRDRVGRVRNKLPIEVEDPVISKVEADAQPIIYLAFYSDRHSPMQITDYADRYVKDRLQNLAGVADVRIFGERKISMRIWLKPERLSAYNLTPQDVEAALRNQNIEIPAGRIESKQREFTVLSETDLKTPEQFNMVIIKQKGDELVRIRDIGYAEIAPEDVRRVARFNGENAVALGIVKQATANPLEVSKGVKNIIPNITASMPEGMQLKVAYDSSVFIDRSIKAVYRTFIEATFLVFLVIFFFLRNFRATIIPLITIPISIIGTFMMMYLFNFSINTLTLLALVLAIGLVVDDAIVVLENIYRHIEEGMEPFEAALKGSKEIAFAIIAMTLTLVAVYAPIAFMQGNTGKLFTEFAITLAGAVLISGFIALTLSPMMCSKLLKKDLNTTNNKYSNNIEAFINSLIILYKNQLRKALNNKKRIVWVGFIVAAISFGLLLILKSELAPIEDRGTIVGMAIAPEGSTIDYTSKWMGELEKIYQTIPEVEKYFVVAGSPIVSQGISFVRLFDWSKRDKKQQQIVNEIAPRMSKIPGIMAFPVNPPSLGKSSRSRPIEFIIQTNGSYEELDQTVNKLIGELEKSKGVSNIDSNLKLNKPQLSLHINREKAATSGVEIAVIGRTLETLLGGRKVTRFKQEGEQYEVIVQIEDSERTSPGDLNSIYIKNNKNEMIKLSNLVDFDETVAPRELNHFNQLRAVKLTGNIAPGSTLGEALKLMNSTAKK